MMGTLLIAGTLENGLVLAYGSPRAKWPNGHSNIVSPSLRLLSHD